MPKVKRLDEVTAQQFALCNQFNRDMFEEFIANSTQLSPKTINAYRSNLRIWLNWVRENLDNKRQIDIKPREYIRFQNWLLDLNHSSCDISNKRSAISTFNNYIVVYWADEYPTFHNFINSSIPKPEKSAVHKKLPPSKAEMQMMIDMLENSDRQNKKELIAYLKFTFETGCRREESRQIRKDLVLAETNTASVKVKDTDGQLVTKTATYYLTPEIRCKGKGRTGKIRQFKFTDYSMDAFKEWLDVRGHDDCELMFTTKYQGSIKQVSLATFNSWCTSIFTPLLGRRFHPHALREARATTSVVEDGKSLDSVRSLLGHSSSETTKIYVCGVDSDAESDELFVSD